VLSQQIDTNATQPKEKPFQKLAHPITRIQNIRQSVNAFEIAGNWPSIGT
jgi:hypothetical protein